MSVESDGIGESFDDQMRMGTMAAMQVGQRMAQARAERMRRTQEESQQRAPATDGGRAPRGASRVERGSEL